MKMRHLLATIALAGIAVASAEAQEHKPGGLNKVAHDVSKTMKKAGKDTKAEVKRDAARTHKVLTKAGNDTKAELKRTTGVTSKSPDATHKPGGLNKLARDVSHASKKTGAEAKHDLKDAKADAHHDLTKAGKEAKAEAKKTTP